MCDQGGRTVTQLRYQRSDIRHEVGNGISSTGAPVTVAMPAQIRHHYMPVVSQLLRQMIPDPGMLKPAMQQNQQGRCRVTPIQVMQAQTAGMVETALWLVLFFHIFYLLRGKL